MTKRDATLAEQTAHATDANYRQLVADATDRVRSGQLAAFRAVNKFIGTWAG